MVYQKFYYRAMGISCAALPQRFSGKSCYGFAEFINIKFAIAIFVAEFINIKFGDWCWHGFLCGAGSLFPEFTYRGGPRYTIAYFRITISTSEKSRPSALSGPSSLHPAY